jgi:hypothetical protein
LLPSKSPSENPTLTSTEVPTFLPSTASPTFLRTAGSINVNGYGDIYVLVRSGNVVVGNNSFTMKGNSRVYFAKDGSTKFSLNNGDFYWHTLLLGMKLSYNADISNVGCGCNAAAYFSQMPGYDSNGNVAQSTGNDFRSI